MPNNHRPSPSIPDHEVLRKIGGGAYGEVWMARAVTGTLRAVKVVWREDFDDERGFEREFEGILKFEPLSRTHPGLVHVLHVGRSPDGKSFYYYVMELGDDMRCGQDINPIEYEPRTLRSDHKPVAVEKWPTGECIDVGLRLAEALDHLHEQGLAHRDVKPSNVIFVNGKAKLADIGLVAARDQRTFVGTEGFVPPEGPGSAQADVYSLGKVLYEMATGKDRLDFPELPDELPNGGERKRWLELNRIICDICEPRISKRGITSAGALAEALRRLQHGKRHRRHSHAALWLTTAMLASFAAWIGWEALRDSEWFAKRNAVVETPPQVKMGKLRVNVTPEGSEVIDADGRALGTTPTGVIEARVGEQVSYTIRKEGHRPLQLTLRVPEEAASEVWPITGALQNFSPPVVGEIWQDHFRNRYQPVGDEHIGSGFVTKRIWTKFLASSKRSEKSVEYVRHSQNGQPVDLVLASHDEAIAFCDWLRVGAMAEGYLTEDYEAVPRPDEGYDSPEMSDRARNENLRPFKVLVREIRYGGIQLTSQPPGADVYVPGFSGRALDGQLSIPKVKPGNVEMLVVLEGYKPLTMNVEVEAGEVLPVTATLEKNQGVVFGKEWENGIGMRFVPLGRDLMVSVWETRVRDYQLFVKEAERGGARAPDFPRTPDHPIVFVSRAEAVEFCKWLTEREKKDERIDALSHVYRLPTDLEWSLMAGLREEREVSPAVRDARKPSVFPWGTQWPPGAMVGNFADETAALAPGMSSARAIGGYTDGFAYTAPVGSFPPNELGIYDLSGNVQEWVSDDYSKLGDNPLAVLRGGGWTTYQRENLYSGSRNAVPPNFRDAMYGFRIVLARVPKEREPLPADFYSQPKGLPDDFDDG